MFLMDASAELNPKNKAYLKALNFYIWGVFKEDLTKKDLTTENFLENPSKKVTAKIRAKQKGILAGLQETEWFLKKMGIKILKKKKDGAVLKNGELILEIEGKASSILATERTLLNLLQRMSGVATKTKQLADKLPKNIELLATRKTLWGLLDKRAVSIGGGGTHRLNLSDAILVKENHIALSSNFEKSLESIFKKINKVRFVEVELENGAQVNKFLKIYEGLKKKMSFNKEKVVVMLDNFKPQKIKKVIGSLKKAGLIVEVSGGINEKNISDYIVKGVDGLSSGAITMAAPHLDINLTIES